MIKALLFINAISFCLFHDVPVTEFVLFEKEDRVNMTVEIESPLLGKELGLLTKDLSTERVQAYLDDQTTFIFNGKEKPFIVDSVEKKGLHLLAHGRFKQKFSKVNSIHVVNTCFNNEESHFSNIILQLPAKERGFQMNNERTKISIQLQN